MKKYLFLIFFLLLALCLYSMPDESTMEVSSCSYVANLSHEEFMRWGGYVYSSAQETARAYNMQAVPITKMSSSLTRKIGSRLDEYDHGVGDMFFLSINPYGLQGAREGYVMALRFTGKNQYEFYCSAIIFS